MSEGEEKEVRRGTVLLMTDNAVHSIEQLSIVVTDEQSNIYAYVCESIHISHESIQLQNELSLVRSKGVCTAINCI